MQLLIPGPAESLSAQIPVLCLLPHRLLQVMAEPPSPAPTGHSGVAVPPLPSAHLPIEFKVDFALLKGGEINLHLINYFYTTFSTC